MTTLRPIPTMNARATDTFPVPIPAAETIDLPGRAIHAAMTNQAPPAPDACDAPSTIGGPMGSTDSMTTSPAPELGVTHTRIGGQPVHNSPENQIARDGLLLTIKTLGNLLDDLERVRIMNANRISALEREFGSSMPELDVIAGQLRAVEHEAELNLKRAWRRHPLAPWAAAYPGIGEKLIARLIAEIGDPAERPNPAKLWAYCGVGDPARKRRSGMTQEEAFKLGNPHAKKICWLISDSFVKVNRGPGREQYDLARDRYAERVHATACVRCGPSGHPAAPGSPWSLKHQHEAAKRYAVKQFLKELWIASRQSPRDNQHGSAGGES